MFGPVLFPLTPQFYVDALIEIRQYRFLGMAAFDLTMVALLSYWLATCSVNLVDTSYYSSDEENSDNTHSDNEEDDTEAVEDCLFWCHTVCNFFTLICAGVMVHHVLKINTQLNYWIGLTNCPPNTNSITGIFSCNAPPPSWPPQPRWSEILSPVRAYWSKISVLPSLDLIQTTLSQLCQILLNGLRSFMQAIRDHVEMN